MPTAHRMTFDPRFLFSSLLIFSFLCFTEAPSSSIGLDPTPAEFLAAYLIGALLAFSVVAIRQRVAHPLPSPYICALPVIAGFALAFTYHAAHFGTPLQVVVGACLIGAGSALLGLQWFCAFSQLGERSLETMLTALFLVAFTLKCALSPILDGSLNLAVLGACVLISAVPLDPLLRSGESEQKPDDTSCEASSAFKALRSPHLLVPLIGCSLCCLIWGLMWGRVNSGEGLTTFTLSMALQTHGAAALACLVLLVLCQRGVIGKLQGAATTLGVALFLLGWLIMLPRAFWSGPLSSLATGVGFALTLVSFWVSLSHACAASDSFLRLCAIALGLLALVILLAAWCAPYIDANLREIITPGASIAFFLIASFATTRTIVPSASPASGNATERHYDPITLFAETHDLSPRETEVFSFFVQGYSTNHIADALVVSQHTVKTHVKRIYSKVGVHSKNELIEHYSHWKDTL